MKLKNIFLVSSLSLLALVSSMATFAASSSLGQIQVTINNTTGQAISDFSMFPGWKNITPNYVVNTLPVGKTTLEFNPIDSKQQSGFALMAIAEGSRNYFTMYTSETPATPGENLTALPQYQYDYGCEGFGTLQATTCHARLSSKGVYEVTVDVNPVH